MYSYIDGLDSVDDLNERGGSVFMCLIEDEMKGDNGVGVTIGMITICPSTGDVVWDDFDGSW